MSAGSDKSVSDETMPDETVPDEAAPDELAREALLGSAAGSWAEVAQGGQAQRGEHAPPGEGIVDVPGFLREDYRPRPTAAPLPPRPQRAAPPPPPPPALRAGRP